MAKDIDLPSLETGDYLYFCNMGAYTLAASTTFNGMNKAEVCGFCKRNITASQTSGDFSQLMISSLARLPT